MACEGSSSQVQFFKIVDGFQKSFAQLNGGFPMEDFLGLVDDGLALCGVVGDGGLINDF